MQWLASPLGVFSGTLLIAAIAIRHDAVLLHQDADYEAIADVSSLRQHSLRQ